MAQVQKAEVHVRVAEEAPVAEAAEQVERIHFPGQLIVLAKRKVFISKFVGIAVVLSVITVFLLPKMYTANAVIMPPQQNQSMALTAMASQLGPLAALAGKDLGLRNPSDIYVAMLHSRTIEDDLIDRFSLMSVYGKKLRMDARRRLENLTEVTTGKGSVLSISVQDRDPQRAADLANAYVDELEKLTKVLNVTEAGKRRLFFEREVKMENEELANAEVALKQTQEKTGLILLDSQSRAMIESVTSLRAGIAAQEVKVQAMRSFATTENPDLVLAEQELATMRAQLDRLERGRGKRSIADVPIENVPTAGLEYIRKLRDVKYHEALFALLARQFEAAKIDEARDALIVQQLDKAVRPEKHSWPKRGLLVLGVGILALVAAITAAFWMEEMHQAKDDPQFASQLEQFQFYLRGENKP